MVAATFGCVFDILRTGIVFVPLVGSSAVFGLVGGFQIGGPRRPSGTPAGGCDLAEPVAGERRPDGIALRAVPIERGATGDCCSARFCPDRKTFRSRTGTLPFSLRSGARLLPYVKACPVPLARVAPYLLMAMISSMHRLQ